MTEEEIKRHLATCLVAMVFGCSVGRKSLDAIATEIHRLRAELESVRADRHDLWQLVDKELDRIYCDLKGIEQ